MNKEKVYLVTCESVTEGHPDKFCDQISDAILEDILLHDPTAHVAIEVMASKGKILISGEVSSSYTCDYISRVTEVIKKVGYSLDELGDDCDIEVRVSEQSPDIAQGVQRKGTETLGAGDQGIMYGYATNETILGLPLPYVMATNLSRALDIYRHANKLPIKPDGKTQVTVAYDRNTKEPIYIDTVVVSVQHSEDIDIDYLRSIIKEFILDQLSVFDIFNETDKEILKIYINPTGRFVLGGPAADTGLTGRKLAVDTYGGVAHHGGGAFSGKDPTKLDRSGAYAARWVAKHVLGLGLVNECEVAVSYAIGRSKPIHLRVATDKPELDGILERVVEDTFNLTPSNIINELHLRNVRYSTTAVHGHFTSLNMPWEVVDPKKLEVMKSLYETYSNGR